MITYRVEFSRPGQPPFAVAHQRTGGRYGPTELVPLGGSLEILAGNLCGTGELTLNRVPERGGYRLRPLDRVQVFFSDSPEPVYLGEVACDPRPEKEGGLVHLKLQGLWERVKLAAWSCETDNKGAVKPLKLPFKEYILAVLSRVRPDLPPDVTIGAIPEVNATLRAVTIHELLGDTFQTLLPVTQGGSVGINAKGELTVALPDNTRRHRFIRTKSERPPGDVGQYHNAIRFGYTKPDGSEAYFVYRYGLEIAQRGASWLNDTLPSSITSTVRNPYAGQKYAYVKRALTYPDPAANYTASLHQQVMSPEWGGKMADGLPSLKPRSGRQLRVDVVGSDVVQITPSDILDIIVTGEPGLPVVVRNTTRGGVEAQNGPGLYTIGVDTYEIRYDPAALADYRSSHGGQSPFGFDIDVPRGQTRTAAWTTFIETDEPSPKRFKVTLNGIPSKAHIPAWTLDLVVEIGLDDVYQWRSGDVVSTGNAVSGVAVLPDGGGEIMELERLPEPADPLPRGWRVPRDVKVRRLILRGDPTQIGWVSIALADEAGLTAYAIGKLLSLVNPILSWKGKYDTLRRLDVRGAVAFDDEQGDTELDIVRGVYDLTGGRCMVEAGTKQALDDSQALSRAFEGIERVQRLQQRPGGRP